MAIHDYCKYCLTKNQITPVGVSNFKKFSQPATITSLSSPTPVPFGVSTDLSILILGGMFGASRLRKNIAARKQISNQEA